MRPERVRIAPLRFSSIDEVLQNLKQSLSSLLGVGSFFIIFQLSENKYAEKI
jgi:hypothetical protein